MDEQAQQIAGAASAGDVPTNSETTDRETADSVPAEGVERGQLIDRAGNSALASNAVALTVDTAAPLLTLATPGANGVITPQAHVMGSVADNLASIASTRFGVTAEVGLRTCMARSPSRNHGSAYAWSSTVTFPASMNSNN